MELDSLLREELLKIKYLFDYKKGVVISEQNVQNSSKLGASSSVVGGKKVVKGKTAKVSFSKEAKYPTDSDDPKSFINDFYTEILNKLKQQNPENIPVSVIRCTISAGASNSYQNNNLKGVVNPQITNKDWTNYNLDNSRIKSNNKFVNVDKDKGYKYNLELSSRRANRFWTDLKSIFVSGKETNNVSISDSLVPKFNSYVVDTAGYDDDDKNRPSNLKPGQFVGVDFEFSYSTQDVIQPQIKFAIGISSTSTWWCDGSDGAGVMAGQDYALRNCYKDGALQTPDSLASGAIENTANPKKSHLEIKSSLVISHNKKICDQYKDRSDDVFARIDTTNSLKGHPTGKLKISLKSELNSRQKKLFNDSKELVDLKTFCALPNYGYKFDLTDPKMKLAEDFGSIRRNFISAYQVVFNGVSVKGKSLGGGGGIWTFKWENGFIVSIIRDVTPPGIGYDSDTNSYQISGGKGEIINDKKLLGELRLSLNSPKYSGGQYDPSKQLNSFDVYVNPYLKNKLV
jgi:hypothetical protein